MKVALIDVDTHHFPNLCLMKLSAYHKFKGNTVEWYNPKEKWYDLVYMSKVFSDEYSLDVAPPHNAGSVIKGGTGYALELSYGKEIFHHPELVLPDIVEHIYPDYSLYPEYTGYGKPLKQQTAYGFLTRGCPRKCGFCHVGEKEGTYSRKVANLSEFWEGQGNICLLDPNFLACFECDDLFDQLINTGAQIEFNQGLDARLITPIRAELLASMRLKTPHFAMDRMISLWTLYKTVLNSM